jgi:crotonobetainyl-CoA:carnitine CoA-transferase CaiB-like acyl-CoA transferase
VIDPPDDLRDDARDPAATQRLVAQIIASESAAHWHERFAGHDCCCNPVVSPEDALADLHFRGRGLFDAEVADNGQRIPALPVPLAPTLRGAPETRRAPQLGEANPLLDGAALHRLK